MEINDWRDRFQKAITNAFCEAHHLGGVPVEQDNKEQHKNRIYVGAKAFDIICKHLGILYGSQFKRGDITYIRHEYIGSWDWITLDPELGEKFEEIKLIQKWEELKKSITEK